MEVQTLPPAPSFWINTLDRLFYKNEAEKKIPGQFQSPVFYKNEAEKKIPGQFQSPVFDKNEAEKKIPDQFQSPVAPSGQSTGLLVGSCKSSKGIAKAVVDANAIIQGLERLDQSAYSFFSVAEVISEIRDKASRHLLNNSLLFNVDTRDPSPEALKKVVNFAKETGDLQTLSDVDLKLIALTYDLESQDHGTKHLRDSPPPIQSVNVKRLPETDLPGWGSNVPNLKEWEALENAIDDGANHNSRVLRVKHLSLDVNSANQPHVEDGNASLSGNPEDGENGSMKSRRNFPKKKDVKIDGKKMVASSIEDCPDDWQPAVSRSTHRRFLRSKARREISGASFELGSQQETPSNMDGDDMDDSECKELVSDENYEQMTTVTLEGSKISEEKKLDRDMSASLSRMKLNEEHLASDVPCAESGSSGIEITNSANGFLAEHIEINDQEPRNSKIATEVSESGQSCTPTSLSESSVACVTSDFAMQNVILQMGLRVLAPGGMQIRELHRWELKCHACFKVTTEIGRIFCPSCGNGGTLRKVAVTVSENGGTPRKVSATGRPRISLRGTKFSLPLPQGGRDAVSMNPVLREDQLPQKFLYPKTKKKNNKEEDEFFIPDQVFQHHTGKKSPHQPPVRKAQAVFSGKRNPNDNHYAPPKR